MVEYISRANQEMSGAINLPQSTKT